ncbi:TetR/AcrR family transcriptional regulator [Nocardioides montaniterrae]
MASAGGQVDRRQSLVAAAARVLADQGPAGFSARRVTAVAGTSTMAVYSTFGSMETLLEAVVDEGFRLLEERFTAVAPTEDPLRDVAERTMAYVGFAAEHRDLYGVMFGTTPLGRYRRTSPDQLRAGREGTLDRIGADLARAADLGRISRRPEANPSFLWWSSVHGYTLLETSGHVRPETGRQRILAELLVTLFAGLGDDAERASASVAAGLAAAEIRS